MERIEKMMTGKDVIIIRDNAGERDFMSIDFIDGTVEYSKNISESYIIVNPKIACKYLYILNFENQNTGNRFLLAELVNDKQAYRELDMTDINKFMNSSKNDIKKEISEEFLELTNPDNELLFRIGLTVNNKFYLVKNLPVGNFTDVESVEDLMPYLTKEMDDSTIFKSTDMSNYSYAKKVDYVKREMIPIIKSTKMILLKEIPLYLSELMHFVMMQEINKSISQYKIID